MSTKIPKVGLLLESSRAAGRALLKGIANYSHHHAPWSFYWEPSGFESRRPIQALDADGIIFRDVKNITRQVLKSRIPAVVVGHRDREVGGLVNLVTDSESIAKMAAEHLMGCGFRHFAFCGLARSNVEQTPWSQSRYDAFTARLVKAGFAAPAGHILARPGGNWQGQRHRLEAWLASLPKPVGIMACNDDCGAQIIEACKQADITVPDSVGVVGVDDDELICGLSDPPMTSVKVNFERGGYEAAQALARLMRGDRNVPGRIVVYPTHVVARRSTDVIAVEDGHVARAVTYIRDHARRAVSVNEVAKHAGLSRRVLERRIRLLLGVSVLDEIRRVRSGQIVRLLVETDWPVTRIASELGFADVRHFARFFRATTKHTPLAYRKSHRAAAV